MSERNEQETSNETDGPTCRHHWIIEAPNGATSRGACRVCGMVRDFSNAGETIWEHRGMNANASGPRKGAREVVKS